MPFTAQEDDAELQLDKDRHSPKSHIDIVLDSPYLTLRGTGPDVEPTRLSGNVVLSLIEATDIKEITLQFRGKARIPVPGTETIINNVTALTYVVCNHNWSFLEGSKHTRTLKSGRHFFPFHLEIGGSLPSSISTHVLGGASIAYKLRAVAVRPLLAHNLQAMISVPLIRSFTPEGLEYQQTLEIENTWPEKLMYSIVLPHKAWVAGDKLAALVKFSSLVKGVAVQSILSNVVETTRVFARSGSHEDNRVVASSRHDFIEGRSVLIETNKPWLVIGQSSPLTGLRSTPASSPPASLPASSPSTPALSSTNIPQSVEGSLISSVPTNVPSPDTTTSGDIVAALFLPLPDGEHEIVPSHTLEPITVSHRVRWSIYIRNPDMHLSELRCSLPISILHGSLFDEVRGHTRLIRRCVLAPGLPGGDLNDDLGMAGGNREDLDDVEDRELPSYMAHVRDRVANMYLSEAVTMRVTNPWVLHATSPTLSTNVTDSTGGEPGLGEDGLALPLVNTGDAVNVVSAYSGATPPSTTARPNSHTPPSHRTYTYPADRPGSRPTSGYSTPFHAASPIMSHLPHAPGSGESTPLDWINSELMMSLSEDPRSRFGAPSRGEGVQGGSSHAQSGAQSKASSPEHTRPSSRPMTPVEGDGHAHAHAHGKGLGGFFKGAMKGLSFTKHHAHGTHSAPSSALHPIVQQSSRSIPQSSLSLNPDLSSTSIAGSNFHSRPPTRPSSPFRHANGLAHTSSSSLAGSATHDATPGTPGFGSFPATPPTLSASSDEAMLHRAYTEVPDYSIAAKGFIGGVPPLSCMRGLPSYEESARASALASASQQDIAGRSGHASAGVEVDGPRRVLSDGNLVRRFHRHGGLGMMPVYQTGSSENNAPMNPNGGSGNSSEDDGAIEIRARKGRRPLESPRSG